MHTGCLHKACEECYKDYIEEKIRSGPSSIFMTCPSYKCPYTVFDNLVLKVLGSTSNSYKLYEKHLLDDFMRVSPTIVVCTKPDCNTSIEVTETVLSKNDN